MPPDPILGLLSFVGLLVYGAVGGVVGTMTVRLFEGAPTNRGTYTLMRGLAGVQGGDTDGLIGFGFAAALWPIVVALAIVASVCAGPVLVAHRVGRYIAAAQIKDGK